MNGDVKPLELVEELYPNLKVYSGGFVGQRVSTKNLKGEELRYALNLSSAQKKDFIRGRLCAQYALSHMGIIGHQLLPNQCGVPLWPNGIVGSISHSHEFCGAVIASANSLQAIGFDTEEFDNVYQEMFSYICRPQELELVMEKPQNARVSYVTTIFSVKEAFYKCFYPIYGRWLDFHDVEVKLCQGSVTILACKGLSNENLSLFAGNYVCHSKRVFSSSYFMQRGV